MSALFDPAFVRGIGVGASLTIAALSFMLLIARIRRP